jgi:L-ribulose-5-phosphate 4-epimerase
MNIQSKVAQACNILFMEGHTDTIYGHVSARNAQEKMIWMKPAGLGLEEVKAEDIIQLDFDGNIHVGDLPRHMEFPIHTEIFRQRADVHCVIHTHPPHATAFSAVDEPLRSINHEGVLFIEGLPRFTQTSDLIVTPELGRAVTDCLESHNAMLLKNHGIVVAAPSVEEACVTAIFLEKAAQMQLLAKQFGEIEWTDLEEALVKKQRIHTAALFKGVWDYFGRKLARTSFN